MKHITNLVVGSQDVDLTAPSHVKGVHEGNWPSNPRRRNRRSFRPETAAVARSTGINAESREPIDPAMPRLSPP